MLSVRRSLLVPLVLCLTSWAATSSLWAGAGNAPRLHTTEHFIVRAAGTAAELQAWGERCEALLVELRAKWFDDEESKLDWSPRCTLMIHSSEASYLREVPGGERTVGSSWIESEQGRIVTRQIDVRGDREDWFEGAMAHELVHVLLADHFNDGLPRWAEEGLALLADPLDKQVRHDLDFRRAAAGRIQFRIGELTALESYPEASRVTTFYGQSASLVRFLVARGKPAQFVAFVKQVQQRGYDAALRDVYGIANLAALETAWLRAVNDSRYADLR